MICAQPHPAFPCRTRLAGLETCSVAQTPNREYLRLEKLFENFKRTNQEGRIPLRAVARAKFCYRSLQGTVYLLYHRHATLATASLLLTTSFPNLAALSEYQLLGLNASFFRIAHSC